MSFGRFSNGIFFLFLCTVFHIFLLFQTNSGKTKNPWCVDDVSAFLKFCCPECNYHIPDIQMFSDHAAENHINSRALFGNENTNVPQQQLKQPSQVQEF